MDTFLPFRAYNTDNQLIIHSGCCDNLSSQIKSDIIQRFGKEVFDRWL